MVSFASLALATCGDDDGPSYDGGAGPGPGGDGTSGDGAGGDGTGGDGTGGDDGSGGTGGTGGGDSTGTGDGGSGTETGGSTGDTGGSAGTTGVTTGTTGVTTGTTGVTTGTTTGTTGATTGTTGVTTGTTGVTTGTTGVTTGITTGATGTGTTSGGAVDDGDGDGIPDDDDPFPDDDTLPGATEQNLVYAHTSSTLFTMDPLTYVIDTIGAFQWPADGGGHQMTDIAIDRYGVLYGVTFDRVYVCEPTIPQCYTFATLPSNFNAMTMVPAGTVLPDKDALIGISNAGGWYHMQLQGGAINPVYLGSYGGYTSSGDAFSIEGVGTYATVNGAPDDIVIEVNPVNGAALGEVGDVTGYDTTYGLAGWENAIFAFDESGDVLLIDPATGNVTPIQTTAHAWWGAGVRTVLPQ